MVATIEKPAAKSKAKTRGAAKGSMTQEHKDALAKGRNESRAIDVYIVALMENKPKRGRKRTVESVQARLDVLGTEIPGLSGISLVNAVSEKHNLEAERERLSTPEVDIKDLEDGFVKAVKPYSERKNITWTTWRDVGVPAEVLKRGGLSR